MGLLKILKNVSRKGFDFDANVRKTFDLVKNVGDISNVVQNFLESSDDDGNVNLATSRQMGGIQ